MDRIKSRKLWLAVGAFLLIVLNGPLGLDISGENISTLSHVVMTYLAAQGITDIQKERGKKQTSE